jgi:hypothetical protein
MRVTLVLDIAIRFRGWIDAAINVGARHSWCCRSSRNYRVDGRVELQRNDSVQDQSRGTGATGHALVLSRRSNEQPTLLVYAGCRVAGSFPAKWDAVKPDAPHCSRANFGTIAD